MPFKTPLAALLPSLHINVLSGKKEQESRAWGRRGTDPGLNTDLQRGIRGHAGVRSHASVFPSGSRERLSGTRMHERALRKPPTSK